jgi:hypothetical protein
MSIVGSGAAILDDDKRERLRRMAANLQRDLMLQEGLGPELRRECLERVHRWLADAAGPSTP